MYYHHFGLNGPPFRFTPAVDALFLSREHREALALLEWGLAHEPTGFSVLVGESGVGKTTLVFSVIARRVSNIQAVVINTPRLTFEQILTVALSQLGCATGAENKLQLLQRFQKLLEERGTHNPIAMVLDEAQELTDEVFGELRLLSNQDMSNERRLRIIFVGQLELLERLRTPQLRALNQRIGARVILNAMRPGEVSEYVHHSLHAHGVRSSRVFSPPALRHLITHSHGIPRRINVLCHNAMLTAYGARLRRVDLVSAKSAVTEYDNLFLHTDKRGNPPKAKRTRWLRSLMYATVTAAMLTALLATIIQRHTWPSHLIVGSTETIHDDGADRLAKSANAN